MTAVSSTARTLPGLASVTISNAGPDEELMQKIAGGEQMALGHLYGRHYLLLRKIVEDTVSDFGDTEEVLQDVFMTIWNRAETYDAAQGKPLGWIICIARRRAIDHLRKVRRYRESHTPWNGDLDGAACLSPATTGEIHPTGDRDLRQHLALLIEDLPSEQKRVLHLAYFENLSQRQIAAHTGIPLGTIKTRLELARRKLLHTTKHLRQELELA